MCVCLCNSHTIKRSLLQQLLTRFHPLQVVYQVEIRNALLAGVFHILLPQRMEHFDYTYAYEYSFFAFSLTKPKLRPKWQSLYYPLANEVWVTIVVTLFLTLAVMLLVMCALVLLMYLFLQ